MAIEKSFIFFQFLFFLENIYTIQFFHCQVTLLSAIRLLISEIVAINVHMQVIYDPLPTPIYLAVKINLAKPETNHVKGIM